MKHIILYAVIIIAIIFSCSFNTVEVVSFSPQGKIEQLSNFTIQFSHDLAPAELIDQWVDTEFIKFEPEIKGKFMWSSANTVIFSAESQLLPIQKYNVVITDKVLFDTKLSSDFKQFSFNTPDFDVKKIEIFWTNIPHQDYKLSVQANISFNYPVDPKKLQGMIEVKNDGQVIENYQIVSDQVSEIIAVNFGEVQQKDKKQTFSIKIKKGLYSVYGKKPLEDERIFDNELPPITRLVITDVTSGYAAENPWIEIFTTQKVEDNIKSFIKLNPEISFDAMINDNSIRLDLEKSNRQNINLTVKSGMPGLYGGKLENEFSQDIVFANVNPSLKFSDQQGLYLLRGGSQKLVVDAVNVKGMEVTYSQVFDNNLIHFLRNNYYGGSYYYESDYYDDDYDYYDYYYSYGRSYSVGDYGKQIFTEKVDINGKNNLLTKVDIDIKDKLNKQFKGIYVITIRSSNHRYISDSKIVSLSNLGIIAKQVSNEIIVFVNQINTTESVSGANVKIISRNNQKIFEGTTDKDGSIKCKLTDESVKGFEPALVVVEKDDDYNFLDFKDTRVNTSRFDVGGLSTPQTDYKIFLYGPRNLYRPGDDVNISGILRNDKVEVIKNYPLIIKIINPSGKVFDEFKKDIDEQGAFDLKFNLPVFAQTGQYVAEVYSGSSQLIGSYYFSTEEFVPDKIRANVKTDKQNYLPNEKVNLSIEAEYLYGAKGSGLDYQIYYRFHHLSYNSKKYPAFNFSRSSIQNTPMNDIYAEGKLDEDGKVTEKMQIPDKLSSSGYINATAYVSVFDPTGRTINRSADFNIYTRDYFIGIKPGGYYFGVDEKINFDVIAVNSGDQVIKNFNAKAKLFRLEWQTVLKKDGSGRYYYTSEEKYIDEWERDLSINDKTPFSFKVSKSGKYELRVYKKDTDEFVAQNFYAWGWSSSTSTSFRVDREGRVEITTDKKEYKPGETAKLLFNCPFSGKMLVTIERNNVYSYEYVEVKNKSAELNIKLKDDYIPNVYVTATLFREHSP
ncbi:MAG: MG2 domain-containing protein, partial [Ignavibacteriaceae bacterium]|nr:MG2 domain-containing protein [Ignavibacteriaceae bacterium]